MGPGLSNSRTVSGSFILFRTKNKVLNVPAKKVFAVHHAAYGWDERRTQISERLTAWVFWSSFIFLFQSSKIHILSPLLLLHCFLKLVSIKTADLSPAPGLLLLSNSFLSPFQSLTKSVRKCGLVRTLFSCATSHLTFSNWTCDSKKMQ